MAFVPLIGLSPFIICNLIYKRNIFKILFITGIFIGSIPTCINFYFSVKKFGIIGITTLFDFARQQALGEVAFDNLILLPINFVYLTFPIGILFLILFVFTRSNIKINYPLLIYFYPLLSLILLLCMSTSYPHYYLFLLPFLSIIFASYLTSNSFRYSFSSYAITCLIFIIILFISSILLFSIFNYNELVIKYTYGNPLIFYILTTFLLLSYFTSIRFLFNIKNLRNNFIFFFYNIIIPQYISLLLLFNFGVLGNPNYKAKLFLRDDIVESIIKSNTIYLFSVDSKTQTLLSYYLPSSKVVDNFDQITKSKYVITSNIKYFEKMDLNQLFISVKKFDKHILLLNISE